MDVDMNSPYRSNPSPYQTSNYNHSHVQRRLDFIDNDSPKEEDSTADSVDIELVNEEVSPPIKRIKQFSTPSIQRTVSLIDESAPSPFISPILKQTTNFSNKSLQKFITPKRDAIPPINPYTSSGRIIVSDVIKRKHLRREELINSFQNNNISNLSNLSSNETDVHIDDKRVFGTTLDQLETSRYTIEFKEISKIGNGSYGRVYQCINYVDGITYAIKKSDVPLCSFLQQQTARKEAFALAALKPNRHIITYYSSWVENKHFYIQMEYCDLGSLAKLVEEGKVFGECSLRRIVNHISKGLKYIHSCGLAHMDIKTENILMCSTQIMLSSDEEAEDVDEVDSSIIYKIGDLGHMISTNNTYNVEDGDSRYMPKDLLNGIHDNIQKVDIFCFGMTLYEVAGGGPRPLPRGDQDWHMLRNGNTPYLANRSSDFNGLIKSMLHPDPERRPTAKEISKLFRTTLEALKQEIHQLRIRSDHFRQKSIMNDVRNCDNVDSVISDIPQILINNKIV